MNELKDLSDTIDWIWSMAQKTPLDPFDIHFEVVPAGYMYEVGAYGLPGRFGHWSHGKAWHQMKTMYDYGLSKIYELIINTDPAQAFLMDANSRAQNILVIAHVIGHSDFFKRNAYFGDTNRKMVETVARNAERIRNYEFTHGEAVVEQYLDAAMSLELLIDPHCRIRSLTDEERAARRKEGKKEHTTEFDDLWELENRGKVKGIEPNAKVKFPEEPTQDVLGFLMQHAPDLEDWQRDILAIIGAEMRYFIPQMQTKIMNEGWASFWHTRIIRELNLSDDLHMEYMRMHAGVLSPSPRGRGINPYYVGFKIWEDIERRWNDDLRPEERRRYAEDHHGRHWQPEMSGREKMLQVREVESDVSFLRNYLTPELVKELDLYTYRLIGDEWTIVDTDWRNVRDTLVGAMTNFGSPLVVVDDANFGNRRELLLKHQFEGLPLDKVHTEKTLEHLYLLWGRPVHLMSVDGPASNDPAVEFVFDGKKHEIFKSVRETA